MARITVWQTLALGVGCRSGCPVAALPYLVWQTLAEAGVAASALFGVFTLDRKLGEPAVRALADALALPLQGFPVAVLEAQTPRLLTPSPVVFRAVGCHGVAESAALAAVGPAGRLCFPRRQSADATCALAGVPVQSDSGLVKAG